MRKFVKLSSAFAVTGALAVVLAGCSMGSNDGNTDANVPGPTPSSSSSSMSKPAPEAQLKTITGKDTQVTLDQGFVDALGTLKLTPGVVGGATLTDGVLAFPITGGHVDYYDPSSGYRPYVQGEIDHDGSGITLTGGGKTVELTDFVIDPGNNSKLTGTVKVDGKEVGTDINIFRLDGTTLKPLAKDADGNAVLEGTTVYVSQDAAKLLNDTFGTDAVTGDLKVGIAKITAAGS
jgi:hypothetical protein